MEDQPPPLPPETSTPPSPPMSLVARLTNIFVAPGEVFDAIKGTPVAHANWLLPAILVAVIGCVGGVIVFSQDAINHQIGEMIDKQMEKAGAHGSQAEAGRSIGILITKISMVAGPAVGAFVVPFWTGLILWLIGAKVLKGNFGFMKAVEAGGLAHMIGVLDALLRIPLIIVVGNAFATLSLTLFVKDFNPQLPAHAALGLVNVMLIWTLIVQSVALAKLSGRSFAVAAVWLFGVSLALTGFFMGIGFAIQAIFKR